MSLQRDDEADVFAGEGNRINGIAIGSHICRSEWITLFAPNEACDDRPDYQVRPQKFGQQGLPAEGTVLPNPNGQIPRDRNISEPYSTSDASALRVGYDLEHRFSDNWQIRSAFGFTSTQRYKVWVSGSALAGDKRTLRRNYNGGVNDDRVYNPDSAPRTVTPQLNGTI